MWLRLLLERESTSWWPSWPRSPPGLKTRLWCENLFFWNDDWNKFEMFFWIFSYWLKSIFKTKLWPRSPPGLTTTRMSCENCFFWNVDVLLDSFVLVEINLWKKTLTEITTRIENNAVVWEVRFSCYMLIGRNFEMIFCIALFIFFGWNQSVKQNQDWKQGCRVRMYSFEMSIGIKF